MKVGTDAAILGAIAGTNHPKAILDVGTGSGIISLMLAQRFPSAQITAIDIDDDAILQANENFMASAWSDRLQTVPSSLANFCSKSPKTFDLIVSNPPYFSNKHFANSVARTNARHTDSIFFEELFSLTIQKLNKNGEMVLIFPFNSLDFLIELAAKNNWYITQQVLVHSFPNDEPVRVIVSFKREKEKLSENSIIIYESPNVYTAQFKKLLADFYLQL